VNETTPSPQAVRTVPGTTYEMLALEQIPFDFTHSPREVLSCPPTNLTGVIASLSTSAGWNGYSLTTPMRAIPREDMILAFQQRVSRSSD
jgi:hypothetical protein